MKLIASEAQEQASLIQMAQTHPITRDYLFAIPNGGKRPLGVGRALKAQGVRAGVPDLMLPYPASGYHGLFIELKIKDERRVTTKEQSIWLKKLLKVNYVAVVCWGWENAWEFIIRYLGEN